VALGRSRTSGTTRTTGSPARVIAANTLDTIGAAAFHGVVTHGAVGLFGLAAAAFTPQPSGTQEVGGAVDGAECALTGITAARDGLRLIAAARTVAMGCGTIHAGAAALVSADVVDALEPTRPRSIARAVVAARIHALVAIGVGILPATHEPADAIGHTRAHLEARATSRVAARVATHAFDAKAAAALRSARTDGPVGALDGRVARGARFIRLLPARGHDCHAAAAA
jgi:hypothetical protein